MPPALVSIHDVMPETLDRVRSLLAELAARNLVPTTLLVVPGRDWDHAGIDQLRAWEAEGHVLAGHGWTHRAVTTGRTLRHRLHAAVLSRDCGEHLSRPRGELVALMVRNHRWFAEHGLRPPRLYVPPAWALGALRPADLADTPFALVESLGGVRVTATGRLLRSPVVGFEADTGARAATLRALNAAARARAGRAGLVRVSLHPHDLELRLADDLRRWLDGIEAAPAYDALLGPTAAAA